MPKTGYKVLSKGRMSVCNMFDVYPLLKEGALHYPKGKKVEPKQGNGALAIFTNRKDAAQFTKSFQYEQTWDLRIYSVEYTRARIIVEMFQGHNKFDGPLPDGTILASSITCLE